MKDIAVALIVFGLLPFVLARPHWGVYLSAWLGYMNPHRLCYGFALTMPFVYITAIVTLVGMLFSKEKLRMIWSREVILLLIFLAWMGVTTAFAFYPDDAWEGYDKIIKIQVLTFMTLLLLNTREKIHMFIWVIVISLGFYGTKGGVFTILSGGQYHVWGPEGTFIGGNNEIALALLMTIPLMRYLHLQESRTWVKLGLIAGMLLTAIAAMGSQSRGALLGMLAVGGYFWIKSRHKFATAMLIIIAALSILSVMPESWYERMSTVKTYQEDASAMGRINAWWTAFNVASDRVTGGGFHMFQESVFREYAPNPHDVHDSHSIYFEVLGEHGVIGLAIYLGLIALTWLKCNAIIRQAGQSSELSWARDLAAMVQVSMIGYATAGAFLGLAYFDLFYHLVAIAVVVAELVKRHSATVSRG